jgi:predicted membrane protein
VLRPSHFLSVLLFAVCASVVFGITQRETPRKMMRYGVYCFTLFVGSAIVLSWLMFFIGR